LPDELQMMRASLKKAIELMPSFPDSYRLLAFINLVAHEQVDESIALLKRAMTYSPGRQELTFMLAQCYMSKEDLKTARQLLEPIANASPNERLKSHSKKLLDSIKLMEDSITQRDAYIKEMEERKKKAEAESQNEIANNDSSANNSQTETLDLTKNQRPKLKRKGENSEEQQPMGFQVGLHKLEEGETQVRGVLVRIDCVGGQSVVLVIKVGEKLVRLYKADLADVNFVSFTTEIPLGGQIGCGPVKKISEVIATFRPSKEKNSKYDGEVVIIEFIPKDFKQGP
jgi:tetratricopeptide (TPR) repeat protein